MYESLQIYYDTVSEIRITRATGLLLSIYLFDFHSPSRLGGSTLVTVVLKTAPVLADQPLVPSSTGRDSLNILVEIANKDMSRFNEALRHRCLV